MRLEQLLYVVMIANCRSISKAAKDLYITQPALSNALRDLEKELGFPIFERNVQGVSLTERGEEFYMIAKSIQNDVERIHRLSAKALHTSGLTIAAAPLVCRCAFLDMIDSITEAFPDLTVTMNELRPKQMRRALKSGWVDVALCGNTVSQWKKLSEEIPQLGLERETLTRWPFAAFLSTQSPLAQEECLSLEQLKGMPIICFQDYDDSAAMLKKMTGSTPTIYTFADCGNIKEAIAQGKGYALLPVSMALDDIYCEFNRIKVIPLKETSFVYVDLIYHRTKTLTEEETVVLGLIRGYIRKMETRLNQRYFEVRNHAKCSEIQLPY